MAKNEQRKMAVQTQIRNRYRSTADDFVDAKGASKSVQFVTAKQKTQMEKVMGTVGTDSVALFGSHDSTDSENNDEDERDAKLRRLFIIKNRKRSTERRYVNSARLATTMTLMPTALNQVEAVPERCNRTAQIGGREQGCYWQERR